MLNKLVSTTADYPSGIDQMGNFLFTVSSGTFAGRMASIVRVAPTTIHLLWSDPPYTIWSAPVMLCDDAQESGCDCLRDHNNNLHLFYIESGTGSLVTRKLAFETGQWIAGAKVVIYSGGPCQRPSAALDQSGTLWVSYLRFLAPIRSVWVKSSIDDGAAWGAGPSDPGEQISAGSMFTCARLVAAPAALHVVYSFADSGMAWRTRPIPSGAWSDEQFVATGPSGFYEHFDMAVSQDGRVGLVYSDTHCRFREFDNVSWGEVSTIAGEIGYSPRLLYRDRIPTVLFMTDRNTTGSQIWYCDRRNDLFSEPLPLDPRLKPFTSVMLYAASSETYSSVTSAAESVIEGDVLHPATGRMIKNAGDSMYLGHDLPFRNIECILSTVGAGGTVSVSYWDGLNWRTYTPVTGSPTFDSSPTSLLLWQDYENIPTDWQRRVVNGESLFWIKLEVTSPFTTGPIGSRLGPHPALQALLVRR